ncbi:protein misato homolog 1 [Nilaparvata lugens]|uniref:protein misato homolog 1 n=1 Tax=Nilaparvata lugens TaxID=108931 RepID=UPI00193D8B91|nr:protein misato homolog 1 [Nilaparvata lugens]
MSHLAIPLSASEICTLLGYEKEAAFTNNTENPSEINNDVLFREGKTRRCEVTFTPRLVLSDLQGSLGALTGDGGLYEDHVQPDPSLALWPPDKVQVEVAEEPLEKNEFLSDLDAGCSRVELVRNSDDLKREKAIPKRYKLDDSVNVWSDYLRTFYHPRSLAITNKYKHNDEITPFKFFGQGTALWKNEDYQEDFTDRIRAYMEEADNAQGFQVLMDAHDAFSGMSCSALQHLKDEYPSKASLAVVCMPAWFGESSTQDDSARVLNWALTLGSLPELCSLFTPVSTVESGWRYPSTYRTFQHLNYNHQLHYHSSAIVAAGLETASLLYRVRSTRSASLQDVTSDLRVLGRAAAALSLRLPLAIGRHSSLLETLEKWVEPASLFTSLTPHCSLDGRVDLQAVVIRGVGKDRLMGKLPDGADPSNPAYQCRTVEEMLSLFISFSNQDHSARTRVTSCADPLGTSDPFPHIFNEQLIASDGSLKEYVDDCSHTGVQKSAALAGLHSTDSLGEMLQSLHRETKRIKVSRLPGFFESGLESLECEEKLEQLLCLSECYGDSYDQ